MKTWLSALDFFAKLMAETGFSPIAKYPCKINLTFQENSIL